MNKFKLSSGCIQPDSVFHIPETSSFWRMEFGRDLLFDGIWRNANPPSLPSISWIGVQDQMNVRCALTREAVFEQKETTVINTMLLCGIVAFN